MVIFRNDFAKVPSHLSIDVFFIDLQKTFSTKKRKFLNFLLIYMYKKLFIVFYLIIITTTTTTTTTTTETFMINTALNLLGENVFVNFVSLCLCEGACRLAGGCKFQVSNFLVYIVVLYLLENVHQRCKPNILLKQSLRTFLQQELKRTLGIIVKPQRVGCNLLS
jgi:hypothetical protein